MTVSRRVGYTIRSNNSADDTQTPTCRSCNGRDREPSNGGRAKDRLEGVCARLREFNKRGIEAGENEIHIANVSNRRLRV
jgi:hypothetical protein